MQSLRLACPVAPTRSHLVVKASTAAHGVTRRAALGTLMGAGALLGTAFSSPAEFLQLQEGRAAKSTIDSQNQARDSAEDQRKRFALEELGGLSLEDRRRRLAREVAALQVNVAPALERGVWWRVRNGIREGGTIRYDLDGLTATVGDKARRRKLVAQQDAAMKALEELDFFAVKRDKAQAQRAFQDAVAKLEGLVGALG